MHHRYMKKGGLTAVGLALVALVAWKAPEPRMNAAAPAAAVASAAPAPSAVVAPVASYAPVLERVTPAVVTVRVEKRASAIPTRGDMQGEMPDMFRRFFGPQGPQGRFPRQPRGIERGLGSGVIVSGDGYILTNNHVVDGAETVKVELPDKRSYTAKVVGTDPPSDLAVLKVDAKALPTLQLGDSDAVRVGDVVLAIGNPLGIGETVTAGIISAKGRSTGGAADSYEDFLQTDAAINHGNSGGALVNAGGDLIGINSQIMSTSDGNIGLGFAIPSNMARNVMDQLIKGGSVHRAKLGVTVQQVTADVAASLGLTTAQGALVSNVESGSAAAHAGVRQGDVITQFNGRTVNDGNELRNAVAATKPGSKVSFEVLRDGRKQTLSATLDELSARRGERAAVDSPSAGGGRSGLGVEPMTPDVAAQVGVPRGTEGVVVTDVDPEGPAAAAGIQEGDVIQKVDGYAVKSAEDLRSSLDHAGQKPALVLLNRKGTNLFLTLRAK